jgi:hypothetical protein
MVIPTLPRYRDLPHAIASDSGRGPVFSLPVPTVFSIGHHGKSRGSLVVDEKHFDGDELLESRSPSDD